VRFVAFEAGIDVARKVCDKEKFTPMCIMLMLEGLAVIRINMDILLDMV
jgi:hypothetical protein